MLNLSLTRKFWKIFSATWLWKISMWTLNYQHILASITRYVRTKWVAPNKCVWNIFCELVQPTTLEHHHQQGKCSCFAPFWICRIQWLCSIFPISTINLVQKIKIVSLFWNLVPGLIRICRIQWWCSIFLLFIGITFFGQIWSN